MRPARSDERPIPPPTEVVVQRQGRLEGVRGLVRAVLLFGANRIFAALPGHALRLAYYRHALGWKIGAGSSIHIGLRLFGGRGRVWIGSETCIQMQCLIAGVGMTDLIVGNRVAIAYRVTFLLGSHSLHAPDFPGVVSPIVIEDYAFIGACAVILAGVTIGEGAVVAAGAVVTENVPPYTVVAGNPARKVSQRTRDLDYSPRLRWFLH